MNPAGVQAWLQRALKHHRAGELDAAAQMYAHLRRLAPKNFDAAHLHGTVALQQGRMADALAILTEARRLDPRSAVCAMRLGIAFHALNRLAEAEAALRVAVALDAALGDAWMHLGNCFRKGGRLDEALGAFERALALAPNDTEARERLGTLLVGMRGHAAAEPHFRRVTELRPGHARGWYNLGVSQIFLGRLSEALASFDRSLAVDPSFDGAYAGRGLALSKCYRQRASVEAYSKALALNPRNHEARSARLYELQYLSELTPEALLAEHRAFGMEMTSILPSGIESGQSSSAFATPGVAMADAVPELELRHRIRIGFLSPDLHRHSVAYFIEPLLAHLDRKRFEIFLYHDQPTVDAMSERLRSLADTWRVVAGQPDDRVEATLRADRLDLLIDLAGHTGHNRLPLYARRLAPVQATYLGYPDTTGLPAMDYRLVDAITDPPGAGDLLATETLVRFAPTAWSYAPPADAPEPAAGPAARGGAPVFGSFNAFAKINDDTLRLWGRLLAAMPEARLLLKGHGLGQDALQHEALRRLAAAGIAEARVELLERTRTVAEHLAAYARMDVALDTFPYQGTTTTCEALWMGVPVVTRAGGRHAARVGASLLTAIGHPEWIAADEDDYLIKAAALARAASAPEGAGRRAELREAMRGSVLLDHAAQAERFGAALEAMARGVGKIFPTGMPVAAAGVVAA